MKRNSHPVEVTDHAVLRYIERALSIDVEEVRQTIADKCATGVELGAMSVRVDGVRFMLQKHKVITTAPDDTGISNTTREIIEEAAAVIAPVEYFFEEGIIRLSEGDFRRWQDMYSNLNLKAELTQLARWAKERGRRNWYCAVQGALNRRNREVGIISAAARAAAVAAGSKKEMLGGGYA